MSDLIDFDAAIRRAGTTAPVLIAGPTASGKSALALAIAEARGGPVVNADALQVYGNWRVLTARPSAADEARAPHELYGHVGHAEAYSVGAWLREIAPLLKARPVIVGGTGLYFAALTRGLAAIPPVPGAIRAEADARMASHGRETLLADLDARTIAAIDTANPARVQRAWEVQRATGRGLADWQRSTPPPLLPLSQAVPFLIHAPPDRLNPRIDARFDAMIEAGALDEARANAPFYNPALPSMRAIGAPELIACLQGETSLLAAKEAAAVATRQYAKRQRTWFRARMRDWQGVAMAD